MERDEISGLILLPEGDEKAIRMIVGQLYRSQIQQGRTIDRQGSVLEQQQSLVEEILEKLNSISASLRGPDDGAKPGLQETVRNLKSSLQELRELKADLESLRRDHSKEASDIRADHIDMRKDLSSLKRVQETHASWKRDLLMVLVTILVTALMNWVLKGGLVP